MQRIILHAGEPKTGSTAIQTFCAQNREALLRLGYLYPAASVGLTRNHVQLIRSIVGDPVDPAYTDIQNEVRAEIAAHPSHDVIISSEYLSGSLRRGECAAAIAFMQSVTPESCILMYIRPQAERVNSVYTQKVKAFKEDMDFRRFALRGARRIEESYTHLLALGKQVKTVFLPYNREVRREGVVKDFLSNIGVTQEDLSFLGQEQRLNESIGPIAIAAARDTVARIRRGGNDPTDRQRKALKGKLFKLIAENEPEPPFYGVDASLYHELGEQTAGAQDAFAQAVWGANWSAVFPPEQRRPCNAFDPEAAEPAAVERYRRMLDELWNVAQAIAPAPTQAPPDSKRVQRREARRARKEALRARP